MLCGWFYYQDSVVDNVPYGYSVALSRSFLGLTKFSVSNTTGEEKKCESSTKFPGQNSTWSYTKRERTIQALSIEQQYSIFMTYYASYIAPTYVIYIAALTQAPSQVTSNSSPIQAQKHLNWIQAAFTAGLIWVIWGYKWKPECCFPSRE